MKQQIERKLIMVLIFACLVFFVLGGFSNKTSESAEESEDLIESVSLSAGQSQEKVIYICRIGIEEIPAVQISEVYDSNGLVTATVARVDAGSGIEVTAGGAAAKWAYKSVSARAADSFIEVAYKPDPTHKGYDWILTLADRDTYFSEPVKDCLEVSDE
jgi:hypothetical protein